MGWLRGQAAVGLIGALGLHGALLGILFFVDPPKPVVEARRDPVRLKLVKRPPPPKPKPAPQPPKPEPVVEQPKPVAERKVVKPKVRPKVRPAPEPKVARVEPPKPEPPPPVVPAPQAEPPKAALTPRKARKFTVSMEATVSGGGVAVPTAPAGSSWTYGSPDGAPDAPKALGGSPEGSYEGLGDGPAAPVEAAEVTVLPKLLYSPSTADMRKLYPDRARSDGIEANVALKILVSARGEVVRVRILKPAGNGFDEVAERLVRRFRFEPGTRKGKSVAVWMPWTYKFRLDG